MCVCIYVCIYIHIYVYIYIYTHTHTHMHTYTYIYIYTHTHACRRTRTAIIQSHILHDDACIHTAYNTRPHRSTRPPLPGATSSQSSIVHLYVHARRCSVAGIDRPVCPCDQQVRPACPLSAFPIIWTTAPG